MMISINIKRALRALTTNYARQISNHPSPVPGIVKDAEQPVELPPYTEQQRMQILDAINKNNIEQLLRLYYKYSFAFFKCITFYF